MIILHVVFHPVPQGDILNAKCYKSFLQYCLHHKVTEKHPGLIESVTIVCDNATAHSADTAKNVL
jgi:hypothetical protein